MDVITAAHDGEIQIIDSTFARVHQQAAKRGPDNCLGRSRGGLTTKIHIVVLCLGGGGGAARRARPGPGADVRLAPDGGHAAASAYAGSGPIDLGWMMFDRAPAGGTDGNSFAR